MHHLPPHFAGWRPLTGPGKQRSEKPPSAEQVAPAHWVAAAEMQAHTASGPQTDERFLQTELAASLPVAQSLQSRPGRQGTTTWDLERVESSLGARTRDLADPRVTGGSAESLSVVLGGTSA